MFATFQSVTSNNKKQSCRENQSTLDCKQAQKIVESALCKLDNEFESFNKEYNASVDKIEKNYKQILNKQQSNSLLPWHLVAYLRVLYQHGFVLKKAQLLIAEMEKLDEQIKELLNNNSINDIKNKEFKAWLIEVSLSIKSDISIFGGYGEKFSPLMEELVKNYLHQDRENKKLLEESLQSSRDAQALQTWFEPWLQTIRPGKSRYVNALEAALATLVLPEETASKPAKKPRLQ